MRRQECQNIIRTIIGNSRYRCVFIASDFSEQGKKKTVNMALIRLSEEGLIKRALPGVYYKQVYNEFIDEYVDPSPDDIAHAIARNYGWTIVPCGEMALNYLGLSDQIPSGLVYVSDGSYKEYTYGNTTIKFKRTTNKDISKLSYTTALVVQALKARGKDNVTYSDISTLKLVLSLEEKVRMLNEARSVTSWVYEYIKTICIERRRRYA